MNDTSNNISHLTNVKKNLKVVKGTCKYTKLIFFSAICRTDIKDNNKQYLHERGSSTLTKNLLDFIYF